MSFGYLNRLSWNAGYAPEETIVGKTDSVPPGFVLEVHIYFYFCGAA